MAAWDKDLDAAAPAKPAARPAWERDLDQPAGAAEVPSFGQQFMAEVKDSIPAQAVRAIPDLVAGGVRGAGSIGATLLWPVDKITDMVKGDREQTLSTLITGDKPLSRNEERRRDMTAALGTMGADTDSTAFAAGKLGGEIAGTAGAGGAIGSALARIPGAATAMPGVISALRTGGMTTGQAVAPGAIAAARDMGTRVLGGAVAGGASAGLVDPSQAGTGAAIGGALPVAVKGTAYAGQKVGSGIASTMKNALGLSTGVGAEPVAQAFKAGRTGNKDFLANMKGEVPLTDVLDRAKQGLTAMSAEKSAQYRSGMIPIAGDKSVLSLSSIDNALQDAVAVTSYKGQVKNQAAASAVGKMQAVIDEWRALAPDEFHTPEGLDALKQKLGGIMEEIPFEQRTARLAAGRVYDAAKATIQDQAPTYAKVMKDYSAASDQIAEIEKALSLGKKASADTAMRKLQSLMRNNVQTNYGNRLTLANTLEQQGGVDLMPSLAGQAMNSLTPRSLSGQMGSGATALGAAMTANPLLLAGLPLQSPRVVGSLAYGAGRMSGAAGRALGSIPQAMSGITQNPQQAALAQLFASPEAQSLLYRAAPAAMAGR